MGPGIGKNENTTISNDCARLSSGISGETRVSGGMYVACADALSRRESGVNINLTPRRGAFCDDPWNHIGRQHRLEFRRSGSRFPMLNLSARDDSETYDPLNQAYQPFLV